jgi:glycosyltransferase involved in cell wall biosynthesis
LKLAPSILQVCAVDFTARRFLLPLMRAQREAGFDVHLACAPGPDVARITAERFPVYPIAFRRSLNLAAHLRAYRRLGRLLRRRQFTIVHAHTPVASIIARLAARRAGVPIVLYTAHGFYFHDAMAPPLRRFHVWLERFAQRRADFLFTQSAEDLEVAVREGIAPPERALAIGNGVDLELFGPEVHPPEALEAARCELGLSGPGPLIAVIGRLVREKGHFEFLEAMAEIHRQFPDVRALVIGDKLPSDRDHVAAAIRARAAELGLASVVGFAGLRGDVPRLLALADVFCLPSWREGMPRSIIEAMATGLPVVATRIRGCREEVIEGQTGLLVPPRDAAALAGALATLVGDTALRRRMGQAGRRRAREHYDERRIIERQLQVLRDLMRQKDLN